jgi:anti-sigma-K factor RskA
MSPDVHTLTGAYVLDALDPGERADFERHIAGCADCARELDELRATAIRLGSAVAVAPPERLRASVLAAVASTRQDPPRGPRLVGAGDARARRRRWLIWPTSVVAGAALLAAGVLAGVTVTTHTALRSAQRELSQTQSYYEPLTQLLAAPDVRTATDSADGGSVTMLVSPLLGRSVLVSRDMPSQPSDRTYQAWRIGASGIQSLGLLGNGSSAILATRFGAATTIGITVEPAGGSRQPTSVPIMVFSAPA